MKRLGKILKQLEDKINYKIGWFFNPPYKQGKERQNSIYK